MTPFSGSKWMAARIWDWGAKGHSAQFGFQVTATFFIPVPGNMPGWVSYI
jgi:hypothetical protein